MNKPVVLTVAGSDSGGGAGIQADLKTFSALGCFGTSAITALTAQNTLGVQGVLPVPAAFVREQMESVLSDMPVNAIKIGMVHNQMVISVVAEVLDRYANIPVVLDPVMVAKGGDSLLAPDAVEKIRELLVPRATVVTPNLPEVEVLLARTVDANEASMEKAAGDLIARGARAVFLKGGHAGGKESADCARFAQGEEIFWLRSERIHSPNTHGTGCTLAAAIAAHLARGCSLKESLNLAKDFVQGAIRGGMDWRLGQGHGPLDHFWESRHWTDRIS